MTKIYFSPILFLLLFFSTGLFAQHSLEGKVTDQQKRPVPYANAILFNAEDSTTVYKGAVTNEEGLFLFENIAADQYVLRVSYVGFEDHLSQVEVSGDEVLEDITMSESASNLDEVSIRYKTPTVSRKIDRLVFNVENSSLSTGSSWDILKKTPMVISANDILQVRNQAVQVYINDRKVHLSASELKTLLENYSGENIRSVEVITNPPAKYDAEGGSILNIVTSKSISPGYKGSLNGAYTQAIYPKYSLGTSHYLQGDDVNVFFNYSFNPRKEYKEDDSYINFMENGQVTDRWEMDFNRTTRSSAHNANLMLDFDLDERNSLNFSSNAVYSPGKTFHNNGLTRFVGATDQMPKGFSTESDLEEDLANIGMDLEWRHALNSEGAQISAKAHYTHYEQDRFQEVRTAEIINTNNTAAVFSTDAAQSIDIFTGQVDYSSPWGASQFELGAKASVIGSESKINYTGVFNPAIVNAQVDDNFIYDENILAAYSSISRDWDAWSIKAGLRGEFTNRQGNSQSMDQVDSREYFELFPTFYLMHNINVNHSLSFDYSRRIQRPRYESLNPFRYYLTVYNFNTGNPNLRAAISNNFNLNYTLKGQYFFDIYYRDNGPTPEVFSFQDNQEKTLRNVSMNVLESISYGLDISHGRSIAPFWYAYTYMSFFHEEQTFFAIESNNQEITNEIDAFFGTLGNSFTLSKDGTFSGDLNFTYVSDWITGSYNLEPMTTLSIGLRKIFWNQRAELSLHLEDILDETNTRMTSRYLNQDNSFMARPESRFVRIGFKYNFGNFRLSDNQRSIQAEERDRL